jgi:conjugative transfer region lipoprotein (TIGR03751 family)
MRSHPLTDSSARRVAITALLALSALAGCAALTGCATNKEKLLPHGELTMSQLWEQETGRAGGRQMLDAREALRRPLVDDARVRLSETAPYTRTAENEIRRQFQRLPNPDLLMYVFPHLAGTEHVPVPGYTTVFPLHEHVQYALPGERTQDY